VNGKDVEAGSIIDAGKPVANYWFRTGKYTALFALAVVLPPVAFAVSNIPKHGVA
jgi:hypothetical protein